MSQLLEVEQIEVGSPIDSLGSLTEVEPLFAPPSQKPKPDPFFGKLAIGIVAIGIIMQLIGFFGPQSDPDSADLPLPGMSSYSSTNGAQTVTGILVSGK